MMAAPAISIIVCTRNRVEHLAAHLPSIVEAAAACEADTEIIVVDNGSTDGTEEAVARAFPQITVLRETRPGMSIGRNTGVRASRATVVLFTDDDVEVPRDWALRLSAPLFAGVADIVVGGIRVDDSRRPPWISLWLLENFAHRPEPQAVDPDVVGASFGALRSVLVKVPFDEWLGAPPYLRHEDGFFGVQARERGFRIIGVSGEPVVHYFEPARLKKPAIHSMFVRAGSGSAYVWYHWAHGVAPRLLIKSIVFRMQRIATLPWLRRHPSDRDLKLIAKIAFVEELRRLEGTPRHYQSPEVRAQGAEGA